MLVPAGAISPNTLKAFLSLPKTTLREYFYLYLPVPVPAGAISRDNTLRVFLPLPTHASSSRSYFLRQHSESISVFTYPCQLQQELFLETTLWKHFYLYLPMPVPAGAISREHFYLYLCMPVLAGTISRDNTARAFLALPTHASSSRSYSPGQHSASISIFTYPCQSQQEHFPETTLKAFLSLPTHASSSRSYFLRQHSESISVFTYPCQFQQELFPETTLWEHFYLYLPMPVPAGAISWDNTPRAFLSLPTHASSSRSYFQRQHSKSISIFTYLCQFQGELFPKTTLWQHFYLYLPMPVPAGAISRDKTPRAFLSLWWAASHNTASLLPCNITVKL